MEPVRCLESSSFSGVVRLVEGIQVVRFMLTELPGEDRARQQAHKGQIPSGFHVRPLSVPLPGVY